MGKVITGLVKKMVKHTNFIIKILKYVFLNCEGFFTFDNAFNHYAYTSNALIILKINLEPGEK